MSCPLDKLDIVDVGPYLNAFYNTLDEVCLCGIRVFTGPFNGFLSCFASTTQELKRPLHRRLYQAVALPVYALLTLLAVPVWLLSLLFWFSITGLKKPYRYSHVKDAPVFTSQRAKQTFTCITSNVCLMHEVLTRFNNQQNTYQKAKNLGKVFASQQLGLRQEFELITQKSLADAAVEKLRDEKLQSIGVVGSDYYRNPLSTQKSNGRTQNGNSSKGHIRNSIQKGAVESEDSFDHSVLAEFPDIDFLCLQETWDLRYTRLLVEQLHRVFPYVVYDVRVDSFSSNLFLLNSGILIASRYPIVNIEFNCYKCAYKQCRLASKGLLQVKVSLGVTADGRAAVGYISNTHLQAYQGTYPAHEGQMNDMVCWLQDFRCRTLQPNEVVAFDIATGDFNVDNMSPVDKATHDHPLFDLYEDVCRIGPGIDKRWTVGTEMRHTPLHDPLIQTPLGLKLALDDPYLLQHYVLSADIETAIYEMAFDMPPRDKHGRLILSPVGGRRRIDYVTYRKGDGVKVVACNPVTQLAGLTDHIPYSLTFNVTL